MNTKFLLDTADLKEYEETKPLFAEKGYELWGATTNPSLIAKIVDPNRKFTQEEALNLQKEAILNILKIVPGSVSAEVYADQNTTWEEMVKQALDISQWDKRISIKLPTTVEAFKARTEIRKKGISVNNTLVFSQEQIFAICLHEKIIQELYNPESTFASFISPFVGRLDDIGLDGMMLVENGMKVKALFDFEIWMLEASVRRIEHIKRGLLANTELMTAPSKAFKEWLSTESSEMDLMAYAKDLEPIPYWNPPSELLEIDSIEEFITSIESGKLNIQHDLTDKGLVKFAQDWHSILK